MCVRFVGFEIRHPRRLCWAIALAGVLRELWVVGGG